MTLLAGIIAISLFKEKRYSGAQHYRVARWVMICIFSYDLSYSLAFFIDPFGYMVPYILILLWNSFTFLLGDLFLALILLHWIEVFYAATSALNKAEMIAKVNKTYDPSVSVEQIQERFYRMTKFKAFFFGFFALSCIFQILWVIAIGLRRPMSHIVDRTALGLYILMSVIFFSSFIIYGRKLRKLMPEELAGEVKTITWKILLFCGASFCTSLIALIRRSFARTPESELASQAILAFINWPLQLVIYSIYSDFNIRSRLVKTRKYFASTDSSSRSKGKSQTDVEEAHVETLVEATE